MKAPPKRKGNATLLRLSPYIFGCLNESPSKKEGKFAAERAHCRGAGCASMKALPKRKGKSSSPRLQTAASPCLNESLSGKDGKYSPPRPRICQKTRLNESPSKKERKSCLYCRWRAEYPGLNESPSEKEGKFAGRLGRLVLPQLASMKAPPKRKGNPAPDPPDGSANSPPQ